MKKFLTYFSCATLCVLSANAQVTSGQSDTKVAQFPRNWDNQKMQASGKQMAETQNLSTDEKIKLIDEKAAQWQSLSNEEKQQKMQSNKCGRLEKYKNASPERKAKMDEHRAMMEKLSPEKREAVKAEMERHRAKMKEITGVDLLPPPPPAPNSSN